jgi:hypothetical protein
LKLDSFVLDSLQIYIEKIITTMVSIFDSIIKDAPNSAIDFNEVKKSKLQTTPPKSKSIRELSAEGQNTTTAVKPATSARITYSIYDSVSL